MRIRLLLVIAAAALLVPAVVAGAAVDVTVVVDYDAAAGELPEGVAVDKRGDVFVSLSPLGQVRKISRDGSETTLAPVVPPGTGMVSSGLPSTRRGTCMSPLPRWIPRPRAYTRSHGMGLLRACPERGRSYSRMV